MAKRNRTPIGIRLDEISINMSGTGDNRPIVSYGYPADDPFDGSQLLVCRAKAKKGDPFYTNLKSVLGIGCDMTGGSSGGPWVSSRDIVSVNSYGAKVRGPRRQPDVRPESER